MPEGLPAFQIVAPTLIVIGTIYLLGPMLPPQKSWARILVFSVVGVFLVRYGHWRLVSTVLPAVGEWHEIAWIWFCYIVEICAFADAMILYLILLHRSDRTPEADRHEARLRSMSEEEFASVDIYIPSFNEPIEVLEKTITGALCLDYPNFRIWMLDDGRRPWLKQFCADKGIGYITRDDNAYAKAGNINAALKKTNADFVAIFDADFIPQQNFLMRTMGFFDDPRIGIVQVPHTFYNKDPMQTNLGLQKSLPDDQRFFFEAIMPSRDAWDAAFCCGSNSVTRRSALRAVGDALPTSSITEDMLLTLVMLRKGFITRYLCEPLAFGLAPENINAFFIQRMRWARGATQILFLRDGPLGPGLTLIQRLMFLPTHWLTQSAMLLLTLIMPVVFLWTGLLPFVNMTIEAAVYYMVPVILAIAGGIVAVSPGKYFPLASQVHGTFQSFRIVPTVLATLVNPFGQVFKVTPKGGVSHDPGYDRGIFFSAAGLLALTAGGVIFNAVPEWRIIETDASLATATVWGMANIIVLFLVCMISLQAPVRRAEERFELDEAVWTFGTRDDLSLGQLKDISLSGAAISIGHPTQCLPGETIRLFIGEVGFVSASVVRSTNHIMALRFNLPPSVERDLMIRKLFTVGRDTANVAATQLGMTATILASILSAPTTSVHRRTMEPGATAAKEAPAAQNLLIEPEKPRPRLAEISAKRRSFAA